MSDASKTFEQSRPLLDRHESRDLERGLYRRRHLVEKAGAADLIFVITLFLISAFFTSVTAVMSLKAVGYRAYASSVLVLVWIGWDIFLIACMRTTVRDMKRFECKDGCCFLQM